MSTGIYVALMCANHLDIINKLIADEALPIEIIPHPSEVCSRPVVELRTWIPSRQWELRQRFLKLDAELECLKIC